MTTQKVPHRDPDAQALSAAVEDVAYRLTHDLSDTAEDIRDALAFAPLAAVKFVHHVGTEVRRRPKATMALVAAIVTGIAFGLWRRRHRPSKKRP